MKVPHPKAEPHPPVMRVLSLGAGYQSTAVLYLGLEGRIPGFDHVIFADTGWEPKAVYDHLQTLEKACAEADIPLHKVTAGNLRSDALDDDHAFMSMPVFMPDATRTREVQGRRQCTREYKVAPISKKIAELVTDGDTEDWRRIPRHIRVEVIKGISLDEISRAKPPRNQWEIVDYPLLSIGWRRGNCFEYLQGKGITPPRSACIGCPYRSNKEWRDLTAAEWDDACEFDAAIRERAEGGAFLHRSLLPLAEADLSSRDGTISLFDAECEGMCGL